MSPRFFYEDKLLIAILETRPMKIRRIRTITISACLSAMLAVPSAGLSAVPAPQAADPVISEELMTRLIRRTLASDRESWIHEGLCALFAMCDGPGRLPAKQIVTTKPDGTHHVQVPLQAGSKDVLVIFNSGSVIYIYLTDKTGTLRAAAISGPDGVNLRLITNEQAAEKYKAEMQFLAKLAEKLPPDPSRVLIERSGGPPIGVPTVLLTQLKKDLGDSEDFPKTVALLAQQLQVEKLALVDPRNTNSTRSFPQDAEFYWLSGPHANCGAGGRCVSQLYWASPSAATSGRLLPTTELEEDSAFNTSPTVLRRSSHGLFDLDLGQMFRTTDAAFENAEPIVTTLTFDGHRYVIQIKKQH